MFIIVPIYQVTLELTNNTAEVTYRQFICKETPRMFISKNRQFRLLTEERVTKLLSTHTGMRFRVWTRNKSSIPAMHELLRIAAVKEITTMQNLVTKLYDQAKTISEDTPVKECAWLE